MANPINETDDTARDLAKSLMSSARSCALAVLDPEAGAPMISRVALVPGPDGMPLSLVSELAKHTRALKENPVCSLLIGEPGEKGDPLTHPRLSLQGKAAFVHHGDPAHPELAAYYVSLQPKAKLYIGFADFSLLRITPTKAFLNGGFGKAYELEPADLR